MPLVRLVPLLCCLLFPLQGMAQAEASTPPMDPVTAPPLMPAPGESQEGQAPDEAARKPRGESIPPEERLTSSDSGSPAVRIPVGILLGTVGAAVGTVPGALVMLSQYCLDSCSSNTDVEVLGFMLGVAGMIGGGALAIDLVGDWLGGQGRFWPTVVGVVLGSLGGLAAGIAVASGAGEAGIILAILGPSIGGVLAYELSNDRVGRAALPAVASRPALAPLVAVSPRGALIGGLAGTF